MENLSDTLVDYTYCTRCNKFIKKEGRQRSHSQKSRPTCMSCGDECVNSREFRIFRQKERIKNGESKWQHLSYCPQCKRPLLIDQVCHKGHGEDAISTCRQCGKSISNTSTMWLLAYILFPVAILLTLFTIFITILAQKRTIQEDGGLQALACMIPFYLIGIGFLKFRIKKYRTLHKEWIANHGKDPDNWPPLKQTH